jgi:hypothetical protein
MRSRYLVQMYRYSDALCTRQTLNPKKKISNKNSLHRGVIRRYARISNCLTLTKLPCAKISGARPLSDSPSIAQRAIGAEHLIGMRSATPKLQEQQPRHTGQSNVGMKFRPHGSIALIRSRPFARAIFSCNSPVWLVVGGGFLASSPPPRRGSFSESLGDRKVLRLSSQSFPPPTLYHLPACTCNLYRPAWP